MAVVATWHLFAVLVTYLGLLFAIAVWGDRHANEAAYSRARPWVYSLALAVYCTSWTFYGAVGRSAASMWSYLPIYLGPILLYVFALGFVRRIVMLARSNNVTSIADFIAARYGHDRRVAVLVTLIALIGVVPYIALQLKGVSLGIEALASDARIGADIDAALLTAVVLALFAILFGTRHISSTESHQGLMVAIAFESLVKLLAFMAVGILAVTHTPSEGWERIAIAAADHSPDLLTLSFVTQTILAAVAVICLPRQFHVTAVEFKDDGELRLARWVFPAYLLLISLLVVPVAQLGVEMFGASAAPDTYMLILPQALGLPWMSIVAFIGGFSAGTAMVIVSVVALSTMVCNEIVMPAILARRPGGSEGKLGQTIKHVRRVSIVVIVTLAYVFYRLMDADAPLAATGLLAFVCIAQLAPAFIGGIFWRRGTTRGAIAGLCTGGLICIYAMVLPAIWPDQGAQWFALGPLEIRWLAPLSLFGLSGTDPATVAALASLGVNCLAYVLVSLWTPASLQERVTAGRFSAVGEESSVPSVTVDDLVVLLEQFFGAERSAALLSDYQAAQELKVLPQRRERASQALIEYSERLLAGVMGAATAQSLLHRVMRQRGVSQLGVAEVLDQTSEVIRFNREILLSSLDSLSQAVSVVDGNQLLVAWNRKYKELFGFPDELLRAGNPVEQLVRFNAERGLLGPGDKDELVEKRLGYLRSGQRHRNAREMPDGRYVEIWGEPIPGGGFITTFSDVSDYKRVQRSLEEANQSLEQRVLERTSELQRVNSELKTEIIRRTEMDSALMQAKALAEAANLSKTRFLAAATHDLMQPLNAARLFCEVLASDPDRDKHAEMSKNIEQSLGAMEKMLGTLLDISRLDAGALKTRREHFPVQHVFDALSAEFAAQAEREGIRFNIIPCSAVIESDPHHLRRILQNFLSNAFRYAGPQARVILGARRLPGGLRLEVLDSGPGISDDKRELIFVEFQRATADSAVGPRGFGLGLSISQRLADLLQHRLSLRTVVGRGSAFAIEVPFGDSRKWVDRRVSPTREIKGRFQGARVLCIDNEESVRKGMAALLGSWGCNVSCAADLGAALALSTDTADIPSVVLVDFHLDDGVSGIDVLHQLQAAWGRQVPAIVITADYTDEAHAAAKQANCPLLRKPLKPAALGSLLSRLLREERVQESG